MSVSVSVSALSMSSCFVDAVDRPVNLWSMSLVYLMTWNVQEVKSKNTDTITQTQSHRRNHTDTIT